MWTRLKSEAGTSLVEVLAALVVTATGTLALAVLMLYGTRLQVTARDATMGTAIARQQFERIRMLPPLDPARAVGGGSLVANQPGYNVAVNNENARFRCRWRVQAGPAGMKQVQMVVLKENSEVPIAQIAGEVWP